MPTGKETRLWLKKRQDLLKCSVSDQRDWNARLFIQVECLLLTVLDQHYSPVRQNSCNFIQTSLRFGGLVLQDWILEGQQGFKKSNIADQCTYRYDFGVRTTLL